VNKTSKNPQTEELSNERSEAAKKRGQNVTIHNYFIRHSQKASGEVFNADKTAISLSSISPAGAERAKKRGLTLNLGRLTYE
jgi:hypothetical protein